MQTQKNSKRTTSVPCPKVYIGTRRGQGQPIALLIEVALFDWGTAKSNCFGFIACTTHPWAVTGSEPRREQCVLLDLRNEGQCPGPPGRKGKHWFSVDQPSGYLAQKHLLLIPLFSLKILGVKTPMAGLGSFFREAA